MKTAVVATWIFLFAPIAAHAHGDTAHKKAAVDPAKA
jgi:hypothetical protein